MGKPNVNINVGGPDNNHPQTYKTVILKPNIPFAQQLGSEDTIYVIKWDYDLGGEEVSIPANCVLKFEGGSLSNGTIIMNEAVIESEGVCFKNIIIGREDGLYLKMTWFKDGEDDSPLLYKIFDSMKTCGTLIIDRDVYLKTPLHYLSDNYNDRVWLWHCNIIGDYKGVRKDTPCPYRTNQPAIYVDFKVTENNVYPIYISSEDCVFKNIAFMEVYGLVNGQPDSKYDGPVVRFTTPNRLTMDLDVLIDGCRFGNIICRNKLQLDGRGPRITNSMIAGFQRGTDAHIVLVGRCDPSYDPRPESPQSPAKAMRAVRIDHNRFHGGGGVLLDFVQDPGAGHEDTTFYNVDIHGNYSDSGSNFIRSTSKMKCVKITDNNLTVSYNGYTSYYLMDFRNIVEDIVISNNVVSVFDRDNINSSVRFHNTIKDLTYTGNNIKGVSKVGLLMINDNSSAGRLEAKNIICSDNIFSEGSLMDEETLGIGENAVVEIYGSFDAENICVKNNMLNKDEYETTKSISGLLVVQVLHDDTLSNVTIEGNRNISNVLNIPDPDDYFRYELSNINIEVPASGTTEQRPLSVSLGGILTDSQIGVCYFDTDLEKPIYMKNITGNGDVVWVDATGTEV